MTIHPTELKDVQRTTLLTLRGRAEEHQRSDRLFHDDQAHAWWSQVTPNPDLDAAYQRSPLWQLNIAMRTYLIDTMITQQMRTGTPLHVVELGAGLSTLPYRLGHHRVQWIGVDFSDVVLFRRALTEPQIQQMEILIAASVVGDDSWMRSIPSHPTMHTIFLAEGLFLYLHKADIQQLIARLRRRFAAATLIFNAYNDYYKAQHSAEFKGIQSALQWTFGDRTELAELGVTIVNVWSTLDQREQRTQEVLSGPIAFPLPDEVRDMHLVVEAHL